jgi:tight adherence protein B
MKKAVVALASLALALPPVAGASGSLEIRRVDLDGLPSVRVTAVVPAGSRPVLFENGRRAEGAKARELSSTSGILLAVDNSASMAGRPLREAKRAARDFLLANGLAGTTGVVAFGHEALSLTRPGQSRSDVANALQAISADTQRGTALYDAIALSAARLERMTHGTRVLVLLTDGQDVGSKASLSRAIAAAKGANVVVYSIAAGTGADKGPLGAVASATGGKLFEATDVTSLSSAYQELHRDLQRSWQITYVTRALPGDVVPLTVRAGAEAKTTTTLRIPGQQQNGVLPASILRSPITAALVVLFAALLFACSGLAVSARRRSSRISRLLEPHVTRRDQEEKPGKSAPLESLLDWTERSLDELPGSNRLAQSLARSGLKLRIGHVPYLAGAAAFVLGALGTMFGAGPGVAILLMLAGLLSPLLVLRIAARRRKKAFDRQLPDVLATVASSLRAGHGLRIAMRGIADDGAPPASEEFARVLGEERLGRPLHDAIAGMCERVGSTDLDYVATAINVQSQAGGSLATLFDTLSETVRERQRHARKVRALTSMGRMSAVMLISLPLALASLMALINRAYVAPLYTTPTGHVLIGLCLGSMAIGALMLKKIVNVRY